MAEIILGIDLGTTFSLVAYIDDEGVPHVIENSEGRYLTPSVVLIEDGNAVVGELAANQAILKRERVVQWIKRSIGDESYRFCGLNPVEISAKILEKLKRDSESVLGRQLDKAVITCPAYFSAPEVENTRKAGEIAGFSVEKIVREPVAAAVYFGVDNLKDGERIMVYDLGGGTFDITILQLSDGVFHVLTTTGNRQLGGHDWTTDLMEYVARQLSVQFGEDPRDDPAVHQDLYNRCELAKCDLSRLERVVVPCVFRGKKAQIEIKRAVFEELTESRIQETVNWCQQALVKVSPPLQWSHIDKILLVGGSTRLRRVPEALQMASGKMPIRTAEVDTMVALGAAVLAKGVIRSRKSQITLCPSSAGGSERCATGLVEVKLEDTCPRNLGTRVVVRNDSHSSVSNSVIIPYGTVIPTEKIRDDYTTSIRGQSHFDVPLVEFDNIGSDVVLKTFRFHCKPGTPAKTRVAVSFRYDVSGQVEVEAQDTRSGELLKKERVDYVEPNLTDVESLPAEVAKTSDLDLVFMFDTTGSMYPYLEQVRNNLSKIVKEIHASMPAIRIAIMAYGDHCDEGSTYLVKGCPFSTDTEELVRFIQTVEKTGGGDIPEAVEDALWEVNRVKWNQSAGKALVLVGDAPPHERPECPYKRDYRAEAEGLHALGVRIYAVWCPDMEEARKVFEWLAQLTGGKFLRLDEMNDLCDLLVAVAMKEGGKLEEFRNRLIAENRLTQTKSMLLETLET